MSNENNNKRIAKNTLMLYFRMILTMVVSLYTSRVVLDTLGVEDFGIYNVVGGVVSMFGFLNGAMASATQRFLSYELGKGDLIQLRRVFNSTLIIHSFLALLVLILAETIGLWFLNNFLNINEDRMAAARWVYHFSVFSFMVKIIQVPYNSVILARERMSVYAYVSIIEVLLKLIVVIMLTSIAFDKLKLYGVLLFSVSFVVAGIYRIYTMRHFDETRLEMVKDLSLYKTLINYSGWTLFGAFSMIAKGQGISILLNIFFGTVVNAAQAVANQVYYSINSFVANFQIASNPQIVKSYASNNIEYMTNLIIRTSKFSFYLLFILTLPVLLEIDNILKIWLKVVPEFTAMFVILILINAWIDSFSGPLITAVNATGKIKLYQIIVGTLFTLNLPISFLFFKFGFSPISTFVVNIFITSLVFFIRLYLTKIQLPDFPAFLFIKEVVLRNIPIVFLAGLIPWLVKDNMQSSLQRIVLITLISIIASILIIYLLGLRASEKQFVRNAVSVMISKIMYGK